MVEALAVVDDAIVGHPEDIFVPIEELDPDIIVLGYDQHHDDDAIEAELDRRGIDCVVRRASPLELRRGRTPLDRANHRPDLRGALLRPNSTSFAVSR